MSQAQRVLSIYTKKAKKSLLFRQVKRDYRIPESFTQYRQISLELLTNALMKFDLQGKPLDYKMARPKYEAAMQAMLLKNNEPSIYCLHSNLLDAIELTDLPNSLPGLEQSVPFGILLLPREIIEPGEPSGVKYIVFSHFSDMDEYPKRENMLFTGLEKQRSWRSINWYAVTTSHTDYSEEVLIKDDGSIQSKSDSSFISSLSSILIQSLFLIQEQDLVDKDIGCKKQESKGFTKMPKTQIIRYPKHLGKKFESITVNNNIFQQNQEYPNSRRSPIPHPRRGHRKIVKYGKARQLSKTVWIKPTYVGQKNTAEKVLC